VDRQQRLEQPLKRINRNPKFSPRALKNLLLEGKKSDSRFSKSALRKRPGEPAVVNGCSEEIFTGALPQ